MATAANQITLDANTRLWMPSSSVMPRCVLLCPYLDSSVKKRTAGGLSDDTFLSLPFPLLRVLAGSNSFFIAGNDAAPIVVVRTCLSLSLSLCVHIIRVNYK